MIRYGKESAGILSVGQPFYTQNESLRAVSRDHARLYAAQPRRDRCKLCDAALLERPDFAKQGVPYALCPTCGHLNGLHQDTSAFVHHVYEGAWYAEGYRDADAAAYSRRRDAIYRPKVDFLCDALREDGVDPGELSYVDVGAGSGYLVAAFLQAGIERVTGYEVSREMIAMALERVPARHMRRVDYHESVEGVASIDADVVTMIGVLEHLQDPRRMLAALRGNPRVRYLMLCMPLFGLCNYLEMVFPEAYPRHLGNDHTHLFTESSIAHMAGEWGLERIAEWWFGSDMLDLYRHVAVTLEQDPGTRAMADRWRALMGPLIDAMQLTIDRRRAGSECHMVFRVRR